MTLTPDMPANEVWSFDQMKVSTPKPAEHVSIDGIRGAAEAISPYIKRTPLLRDHHLSERFGANVYLKYEILQHTGAFKVRGAFNKLLSLSAEEKRKGIAAVSGGNHAQAVAYSAQTLGIKAITLMPEFTPENYVRQTEQYGAKVEKFPSLAHAFEEAEQYRRRGLTLIHPFDDAEVICGQGTVGLEILADVPAVTDVIVSIGGGGLAGGIAVAMKAANPHVNIWGVETAGADSMAKALEAGNPVAIGAMTSIARTLGATRVGDLPFALVREHLARVSVVSDAEAVREMFWLLDKCKVLTEPAASCAVAAFEKLKNNFRKDSHVVLVLCGGNLGIEDLFEMRNFSINGRKDAKATQKFE